ncbi:hypothetical protein RIR_jg2331.t1 [Rhizophagus irregularis DAOM 181602=DAOM 197198]|nr:hypothetical protein RIR_jg2331.t1 [Rhizophagus irregularis DAOM 181602=DAOM 197198]
MYSTFNMLQDKFLKQINSRGSLINKLTVLPIKYTVQLLEQKHKKDDFSLPYQNLVSNFIPSSPTQDISSEYKNKTSTKVISLAVEVQVLGVQYHLQEGEPQSFNFLSRQIPFSSKAKQSVNRIHNMDINDFISDHVGEWFYKLFPASRIHSHKNT